MLGILAAVGVVCVFAVAVCYTFDEHPNGVCKGGAEYDFTCPVCRKIAADALQTCIRDIGEFIARVEARQKSKSEKEEE